MVKLKTTLINEAEPQEGKEYVITDVREITTAVNEYKAIKVFLKSMQIGEEEMQYATLLWTRESAGLMSKLGAFMEAFSVFLEKGAEETDNWIGHRIVFLQWQLKRREIQVAE